MSNFVYVERTADVLEAFGFFGCKSKVVDEGQASETYVD